MAAYKHFVEGQTQVEVQTLLRDGVALDGTGLTVALILKDRTGGDVDTTGKVDWYSEANGQARFSPAAGDLRADRSPYSARWKLTAAGKDGFYPNEEEDQWIVRRA